MTYRATITNLDTLAVYAASEDTGSRAMADATHAFKVACGREPTRDELRRSTCELEAS